MLLVCILYGGADGACKGCWNDSKGLSNCVNHTLDGIPSPNKAERPVPQLAEVMEQDAPIVHGAVTVALPALARHEVEVVTVSKGR